MRYRSALSICITKADKNKLQILKRLNFNFSLLPENTDFSKERNSLVILNDSEISPQFLRRISRKSFLRAKNLFFLIITNLAQTSTLSFKFSSQCNRIFLTTEAELSLTLKNLMLLLNDFSRFDSSASGIVFHNFVKKDKLDYQILLISANVLHLLKIELKRILGNLSCDVYQTKLPPYIEIYHQVAESGKSDKFQTYNSTFKKFFQVECFSFQKQSFFTAFQIKLQPKKKKLKNKFFSAIFSELFNSLPAFGYVCANDRNWTMKEIFGNFQAVTGYQSEEIIENRILSFNDLIAPEYREYIWDKWQKLLKERLPFEDRYEIITKEGQRRWVWERGFGVFSGEKLLYLTGYIFDISEQKQLENKIQEQQELFANLLNNLPLGVGLHRQNRIIYANPEALRLLKLKDLNTAFQADLFSFIHPEEREEAKKTMERTLNSGKSSGIINKRLLAADGSEFVAEVIATPINFQKESVLLVIFRDLSELKKIEKEKEATEQLLNNALLNLKDGVFIVDRNNRVILLNQSAASMIARKSEDCIGQKIENVLKIFDEERAKSVNHLLKQTILEETELIERNLLLFSADGREIPVTINITPLLDIQKKLFARIIVIRNEESERNYRTFLFKERARLQTYLDLAPLIIVVLDINANIVMINKKGAAILEVENDKELIGLNWPENFIPVEQKSDFQQTFNQFLKQSRELPASESEILTRQGKRRTIFWQGEALRDEDGMLTGFLLVGEDITERLRIEKKLSDAEARYELIVETANDGIVVTDKNDCITFCNQRLANMVKIPRPDLLNRKFAELIHPEDLALYKKEVAQRAQDMHSTYEIRIINASQETIWSQISASPIFSPVGEFEGTFGFITDISEKKKIEEIIRESEMRYRLIVENSPAGIFYFDREGIISECNDKFIKIIGSSREKLIGLNLLQLPDQKVVAAVKKALQGKKAYYQGVYSSVTANKTTPVKAFFTPIFNEQSQLIGGFAQVEDLTAEVEAAAEKEKLQNQIQQM